MSTPGSNNRRIQSLSTDEFFYFFLRLRKSEIRRTVRVLQGRYPEESPAQLARRLIEAKATLASIGGTLLHLPLLFPGLGQVLKLIGVVGATSLLTRMHLYMILEIALVFGKDIDDQARVPEMAAVVAATGLSAATPLLVQALELHPLYALPAGSLSAAAVARVIGESAIHFYTRSGPQPQLAAQEA